MGLVLSRFSGPSPFNSVAIRKGHPPVAVGGRKPLALGFGRRLETALRGVVRDLNELGRKFALLGGFAVSARGSLAGVQANT